MLSAFFIDSFTWKSRTAASFSVFIGDVFGFSLSFLYDIGMSLGEFLKFCALCSFF